MNHLKVTLSKTQENVNDVVKITPFTKNLHSAQIQDLRPESGSVHLNYSGPDNSERQLLYELENNYDESKLRNVLCKIFERYGSLHIDKAVIRLDDFLVKKKSETEENLIRSITKVANLLYYKFDKYKKKRVFVPKEIQIILSENSSESNQSALEEALQETMLVTNATLFARDLGNERADIANPDYIEEIATSIFNKYSSNGNLTYKSIVGEELANNQLNLIYAVGQGSKFKPRLIVINYKGDPDSPDSIALVGKGITFDTGGLNLKPTGSIENMHLDMCGSAAVLGTLYLALEQKLKKNITAVLAIAENAIDANAYKPHAIVRSHSGMTVEVGNTDAEGRLVLADALSYTQEEYSPKTIIDVATLTGACIVALGEYSAGLFSNNLSLTQEIQAASEKTFERCWPLPLFPEHIEEIKSIQADIKSTGKVCFEFNV